MGYCTLKWRVLSRFGVIMFFRKDPPQTDRKEGVTRIPESKRRRKVLSNWGHNHTIFVGPCPSLPRPRQGDYGFMIEHKRTG